MVDAYWKEKNFRKYRRNVDALLVFREKRCFLDEDLATHKQTVFYFKNEVEDWADDFKIQFENGREELIDITLIIRDMD